MIMSNPIFDLMNTPMSSGAGNIPNMQSLANMMPMNQAGSIDQFANMLNQRFGSMQKCLGMLNGLLGKYGTNAKNFSIQELKGKHFGPEAIAEFKQFAKRNGASDEKINMVLNELGLS